MPVSGTATGSPRLQSSLPRQRDQSIDTLRGLAIILLVWHHASGTIDKDLHGFVGVAWTQMHLILPSIRMPLFATIAGFVQAMHPSSGAATLIRSKARRLLIPFASATTLTLLFKWMVAEDDGAQAAPWTAYFVAIEHFWFLQSLFLIFVLWAVLELAGALNRLASWTMLLIVSLVLPQNLPGNQVFSLWGATYILPFFILGYGLRRFPTLLRTRAGSRVAGIVAGGSLIIMELSHAGWLEVGTLRTSPLGVATGLSVSYLMMRWRPRSVTLAWVAGFSYTIYLYHGFGLALARRLYGVFGAPVGLAAFGFFLAMGLGLPILAQILFYPYGRLRFLILGELPKSRHGTQPQARAGADVVTASTPGIASCSRKKVLGRLSVDSPRV